MTIAYKDFEVYESITVFLNDPGKQRKPINVETIHTPAEHPFVLNTKYRLWYVGRTEGVMDIEGGAAHVIKVLKRVDWNAVGYAMGKIERDVNVDGDMKMKVRTQNVLFRAIAHYMGYL